MKLRTFLVVDDDPDMRLYLRSCLRGADADRVLEAGDGIEALALARTGVEVVISDVVLPRLDGYGLCRAIKADPELRAIPVLLISGEDDVFPADVGADGFLRKPFNAGQLRTALRNLPPGSPRAPPDRAAG